jgi:hypothetical protein
MSRETHHSRVGTAFASRADVANDATTTRQKERNTTMDSSKMKIVYVITERGGRSFWNRCGVAFVNNDGSLNVKLEAIPVNGEVHIRDYVPREESSNGHVRGTAGLEYEARSA